MLWSERSEALGKEVSDFKKSIQEIVELRQQAWELLEYFKGKWGAVTESTPDAERKTIQSFEMKATCVYEYFDQLTRTVSVKVS